MADESETVKKSIMLERLADKQAVIDDLKAQLGTMSAQVADLKPRAEAADAVRAEFTAFKERAERDAMWGEVGIADPDTRARLERYHRAETADAAADARPSLRDWLTTARESDPLVRAVLPPPAAVDDATRTPAGAPTPGAAPVAPRAPMPPAGTAAAPPTPKPAGPADIKARANAALAAGKPAEARAILAQSGLMSAPVEKTS